MNKLPFPKTILMLTSSVVFFCSIMGAIITLSVYGVVEDQIGFYIAAGVLFIPFILAGWLCIKYGNRQVKIHKEEDEERSMKPGYTPWVS